MRYKNTIGFTLIELLVVIAIISILAAILFPVFAQAREKARQTSCLNNIKQIAIAINIYKDDYDEVYPMAYINKIYLGGTLTQYNNILASYIKNQHVFFCPSSFRKYNEQGADGCKSYNYSTNRALMQYHYEQEKGEGVYSGIVTSPSETYLIWDGSYFSVAAKDIVLCGTANAYLPGSGNSNNIPFDDSEYPDGKNDYMSGRHNLGVNMGFADCHVKYLKSSFVWNSIFAVPSPFLSKPVIN